MRNALHSESCVAILLTLALLATIAHGNGAVLDDFRDLSRWEVLTSDGVDLECRAETNDADPNNSTSLRLDFDFASSGFAGVRYSLPLDLPPNFELAFSVRGDLPRNNLEFKLVDESGECVWWVNRRAFEFPREWTRLASRRRHFEFAWGPSNEPLRRAGAIEIIVASHEGGRGTVWLDDLTFRPLPEPQPYTATPVATASSSADGTSAAAVLDGNADTRWQSTAGDDEPTLTVDFGQSREFGGVVIDWDPTAYASQYNLQCSDDGESWTTVRKVDRNSGRTQYLTLPDAEARAMRLRMQGVSGGPIAIREVEVLSLETSSTRNAFAHEIARRSPRGHYPRAIAGEGTFWTIVGVPVDEHEALVSEDGAVEVDKEAFTIEPFLSLDGRLLTWADAEISQSLAEGFAPVPTVTRDHHGLSLSVTAAADGEAGQSSLTLLYTLTNTGNEPRDGALLLTLRPFQVNPPYQWLNTVGGVSRVGRIELEASQRRVLVDDRIVALGTVPDAFGAATFDEGNIVSFLATNALPPDASVVDPQRAASAAIRYNFDLAPGASQSWAVGVPFSQSRDVQNRLTEPLLAADDPVAHIRTRQQAVTDSWNRATSTFELLVPPEAADVVNTIRSTLAYILINQDGRAIHPGSRSYERSWIRDGSLTATALMRFGLEREAQEFVDWYAPYQFPSGKVPCVVDHRGADPVPENDSHGQYVMAVMNIYRFTGDKEFLRRHWPRVQQAVAYIESLRAERMTPDYASPNTSETKQEPDKPAVSLHAFYGLVPESISHEGYSTKPMHSYWDDFFVLKGLKDAAEMAAVLGEDEAGTRYQQLVDDFARTLYASIDLAMQTHGIDYIPGCVELGDFDATSTTIALWPCDETGRLPQPALDNTFEKYWERFASRRDDPAFEWIDYTPYELRVIGSFVLMGQPERAQAALEFFMNDRRPPAWNQWPEVVHRDPRSAKFIGDLPHTWCGSDFVNSVRMMFLYEREADDALVLLAGVPSNWISEQPIGFRDLPTYGGRLTCTLARPAGATDRLEAHLEGSCPVPAGRIRLAVPGGRAVAATMNGSQAEIDADGRVVVDTLPAEISVTIVPENPR
jgi:hypothetical protein